MTPSTSQSAFSESVVQRTPWHFCWFVVVLWSCAGAADDQKDSSLADTDTADTSSEDSGTDTTDTWDPLAPRCIGSGPWEAVAAGSFGSCGIHQDGCVECWTAVDTGPPNPGINDTGWGNRTGALVPPNGSYSTIAMMHYSGWEWRTCAIRTKDAGIDCWGSDAWGAASPPSGMWVGLSLDEKDSCALGTDGRLACWGAYLGLGDEAVHSVTSDYVQVSLGNFVTCGLAANGRVDCWDIDLNDDSLWLSYPGPWTSMESLDTYLIGVTARGEYANNWDGNVDLRLARPLVDVCGSGLGLNNFCALDIDGHINCGGWWESYPPRDIYTSLSCGYVHACGVTVDGRINCWGMCGSGGCDVPVHE